MKKRNSRQNFTNSHSTWNERVLVLVFFSKQKKINGNTHSEEEAQRQWIEDRKKSYYFANPYKGSESDCQCWCSNRPTIAISNQTSDVYPAVKEFLHLFQATHRKKTQIVNIFRDSCLSLRVSLYLCVYVSLLFK